MKFVFCIFLILVSCSKTELENQTSRLEYRPEQIEITSNLKLFLEKIDAQVVYKNNDAKKSVLQNELDQIKPVEEKEMYASSVEKLLEKTYQIVRLFCLSVDAGEEVVDVQKEIFDEFSKFKMNWNNFFLDFDSHIKAIKEMLSDIKSDSDEKSRKESLEKYLGIHSVLAESISVPMLNQDN